MNEKTTADQLYVRKLNTTLLLNLLREEAPISRAELSKRTGLNRSTVSSIVAELIENRLVRETELQKDKVGRPGMSLELDPQGGCAVGLEIGVDFVSVLLTNFVAQPLWRAREISDPTRPESDILTTAERMIRDALKKAEEYQLRPLGIGVGVPGLVDREAGVLIYAPNLHWHDVPLRTRWTSRFGLPVFVENEAKAAALGEYYFGAARQVKDFIYLSAGVGLGGGIMLDGKLLRGSSGFAGEVGHMSLDPQGERCACGRRGCWETLVSPRAVVRRVRELAAEKFGGRLQADLSKLNFSQVVQAAQGGDKLATDSLRTAAHWLAVGIGDLVNVFNPRLVVLGGMLALPKDQLIPWVEQELAEQALKQPGQMVKIVPSAHNSEACVVGAVALVLDDLLKEPHL